ncbi:MAG: hypothetical protein M3530_00990 [Thermoproteota archaeon]|nr:hypothetical protein [Thermoproteota archaeon]
MYKAVLLFALSFSFMTFSIIILQSFGQGLTMYAFAQEGQGQIRCTNGQLVRSPTECPATDLCPPPPGPTTVAYCSPREPSVRSVPQLTNNSEQLVAIYTDKPTYKTGEIVNITINNTGTEPLTFPNAILGLSIQNAVSHEKYSLFSAQVITVLDSGGTKSVKWDQKDSNGQQVGPGNYTASIPAGLSTANKTFSILQ